MIKKIGLARAASEIKNYSILMKAISVVVISLVSLVAVTYITSYFYDQYGSFTVSVNKYDMVKQGLSLSETPEFDYPISHLNANILSETSNISGEDIPDDVDKINGSHNGDNYIAYTFYTKNTGEDTVTYEYTINIESATQGVDSASRIRIYHDGVAETYARTKADGSGPEYGTVEFYSSSVVANERQKDFKSGDITKFTVVIWLEGDDPECTDSIVGGKIKLSMEIKIVEGS